MTEDKGTWTRGQTILLNGYPKTTLLSRASRDEQHDANEHANINLKRGGATSRTRSLVFFALEHATKKRQPRRGVDWVTRDNTSNVVERSLVARHCQHKHTGVPDLEGPGQMKQYCLPARTFKPGLLTWFVRFDSNLKRDGTACGYVERIRETVCHAH